MPKFRPLSETKFINDANLVSYWKLDGNSNDSKGSNNGTDTSISYIAGQFGQAAEFNATGDYITIPSINFGSGDFTISFWYNPTSTVNHARLWDQYDNPREFKIFQLPSSSEALRISSYNGSTEVYTAIPTSLISTGTWYHITVVKTSDNCNAYVNGSYVSTSTGWTGRTHSGATACGFGGINQISVLMKLDDAAIFSRALSASEVNELYQGMTYGEYLGAGSATTKLLLHLNGNSVDSSGNGNNGTDSNITYVDGKFGKCASFNGSSSKINFGNVLGTTLTSAFTVSMWVRPSSLSGIFGLLSKTSNNIPKPIDTRIDINGQVVMVLGNGSTYRYIRTLDSQISINNTYLITYTWNGNLNDSSPKIYINGSSVSISVDGLGWGPGNGTENLQLGQRIDNAYATNGSIDEVIIENRAWTASEVKKYYTYTKGQFGIL